MKLAYQNKVGKYLRYAFGEIILVVLGILIALQINTWNQKRIQKSKLKHAIENIIIDLNSDIILLNHMEEFGMFRYHSMQYLLVQSNNTPYDPAADGTEIKPFTNDFEDWNREIPGDCDKEFIQLAMLWSHRVGVPTSNIQTINELKSTGLYSQLERTSKIKLNFYHTRWTEYYKNIVNKLAEDWQVSLVNDGFINSDTYWLEDPLDLIRNNPTRAGILKRMIRETGWQLKGVIELRGLNSELITQLESEMNNL